MKQLVHKLILYLKYFTALIKFNWQIQTAYRGNMIANSLSTILWNVFYVVFLQVITRKVNVIAGYSFSDMLVFTFITELMFYMGGMVSFPAGERFIDLYRQGDFDSLLIKPLSILFQVFTCKINTFNGIFPTIVPLAMYIYLITTNGQFHPSKRAILLGGIAFVIGLVIQHFMRFCFVILIFWLKQARNLLKVIYFASDLGSYPLEAYKEPLRTSLTLLAPSIIATGIPVTYLLEKTTSLNLLWYEIIFLILCTVSFFILWRKGLPLYESFSA